MSDEMPEIYVTGRYVSYPDDQYRTDKGKLISVKDAPGYKRYIHADKYESLIEMIRPLVEARRKMPDNEWFASMPTLRADQEAGLCQIDDGLEHGMFTFCCEWHDGRFIALSANTISQIGERFFGGDDA